MTWRNPRHVIHVDICNHEIAAIKKQNAETADTHNYSEAETRDYFIDLLLKEAGWPLDKKQDREYPDRRRKGALGRDRVGCGDESDQRLDEMPPATQQIQ